MHLALLILKTAGSLRKAAADVLGEHGLSPAQFNVLNLLSDQPAGMSAGALAEELVVDPSNITGLLKRMSRDGFVSTAPSPEDGRRLVVKLTAKGRARWQKAHTAYAAELSRLDAALTEKGVSDASRRAAMKTLGAIEDHCDELLD